MNVMQTKTVIEFTPEELASHERNIIGMAMDAVNNAWTKRVQMNNMLTIKDVAERMKKATNTVGRWAREGHPNVKQTGFFHDGAKWVISEYDYLKMIDEIRSNYKLK